jgi:phage head maturation protease
MMTSMERGDITQCSFEMYVGDDKWEKRDGQAVRTVLDADVVALSVVAVPAYPTTSAEARSIAEALVATPLDDGEIGEEGPDEEDDAGRGFHKTPVHVIS